MSQYRTTYTRICPECNKPVTTTKKNAEGKLCKPCSQATAKSGRKKGVAVKGYKSKYTVTIPENAKDYTHFMQIGRAHV